MRREEKFITDSIFHIFNKSISNYGIFKDETNSQRFIESLDYYNDMNCQKKFSHGKNSEYSYGSLLFPKKNSFVKFISYCIMPDHYHLLVKNNQNYLLSKYIAKIENSFAKYFNLKFNRNGHLWCGTFKAVEIKNNEQLLHVSRYIHLNPTTSNLVKKPEEWFFSSYKDFITNKEVLGKYIKEISISTPLKYKNFVQNNIDYQKKLKGLAAL